MINERKKKERRPDEHMKERTIETDEQQTKNNGEKEKKDGIKGKRH